jgi:hypothetical protein
VDDSCIDCDASRQCAPELFADRGGKSVLLRQPETPDEVGLVARDADLPDRVSHGEQAAGDVQHRAVHLARLVREEAQVADLSTICRRRPDRRRAPGQPSQAAQPNRREMLASMWRNVRPSSPGDRMPLTGTS